MSKLGAAWLCASGLVLGCSGGLKDLGNRFPGPTALARFAGVAAKRPAVLHYYVAVASTRGDEIRLIDPEDDTIVPGPGGIFPLSIPTLTARPTRIVSTPLEVAADPLAENRPGGDLAVVVGAGSLRLEVLDTWDGEVRIDRVASVDLGLDPAIGPGATLGAVAAGPVPGFPGRARVFAALAGGRMAVVEFQRTAGGSIEHRATTVKSLAFGNIPAFDVLDIAVAPDGARIFCATADAIGEKPDPAAPAGPLVPLHGVAQIDVPADAAAAWTLFPLDALVPTRLVAVATVVERTVADPTRYVATAALEVFASLDHAACGSQGPINCGIATLLPDVGLAPDPAGEQPYRAPIPVPGLPTALAVLEPTFGSTTTPKTLALLYGASVNNTTTAALAVVSTFEQVYFVDLARWALAQDSSYVNGVGRAQVTDVRPIYLAAKPALTFKASDGTPIDPAGSTSALPLRAAIGVTPGYTYADAWNVTWQGQLPAYAGLQATVGLDGTDPWLAFQVPSGLLPSPGPGYWMVTRPIGPLALGLRVGDLVDIGLKNLDQLPAGSRLLDCKTPADAAADSIVVQDGFRTTVADILPPDPNRWPGGAVRLADLGCLSAYFGDANTRSVPVTVQAALRAAGLVLTAAAFGYAGRPELGRPFEVRWKPEAGLGAEELGIVRRARRKEYSPSAKCGGDACNPVDPIAPGPVVAFTAVRWDNGAPASAPIPTDTRVTFLTSAALVPKLRPVVGAGVPAGVLALDHTVFRGQEGNDVRLYVSFSDDQVGVVQPGGSPALDRIVR